MLKIGIAVASPVLVLVLVIVLLVTVSERPDRQSGLGGAPTEFALEDIPPQFLRLYQQAATSQKCPVPWAILAAVGKVETDHGRYEGPGVASGHNDAGAAGPMQFGALEGSAAGNSWGGSPIQPVEERPDQGWGVDGNGDGIVSVYDPADAIPAAADYLCDHGADQGDMGGYERALFGYNHAQWYVDKVMDMAHRYAHSLEAASDVAHAAIEWARAQVGVYYYWGGSCSDPRLPGDIPGGGQTWQHNCDCSSFLRRAYEEAGVRIGGYTGDQVHDGVEVGFADLQPGDLVFSSAMQSAGVPQHVVMYIGGGQIIHSPSTGRPIEIVDGSNHHLKEGIRGQIRRVSGVQP